MALFVAIEGIDGSGKGTQSALLCERLRQRGRTVELLSFPRYGRTKFGTAIADFLNGRFGELDAVHPQLAALLFAGDRFESKEVILNAAATNELVLFDRYVASNVAHQAAKLGPPERDVLMRWIEELEFDVYQLPRPDLTVLFDLPAAAAQQLIAKKQARTYTDRSADLQEADGPYLERVRGVYLTLAKKNNNWELINCMSDGSVRTVDSIAAELQMMVNERLTQFKSH